MAVRFFEVYGDGDAEIMEQFSGFNDVSSGYWAAEYIKTAASTAGLPATGMARSTQTVTSAAPRS